MSRGGAGRSARYVDEHELSRILTTLMPAMMSRDPARALGLLVRRIASRVATMGDFYTTLEGSGLWRPTIHESDQVPGSSIEDSLVAALRDAATRAVERGVPWPEVLAALRTDESPISQRVATHLLYSVPNAPRREAAAALLDTHQLSAFLPEYQRLLGGKFKDLDRGGQATLVGRITAGPESIPEEASADDYRDWWTYKRLAVIGEALPKASQDRLRRLVEKFGGEDPNPPQRGTWIGPTSPLSEDELTEMDPERVADYLASWRAPGGIFADSPAGLGRRFAVAVERRGDEYSRIAERFQDLHATYVRELINGLRNAVEKGTQIAWDPVLALLLRVVRKPRADPGAIATDGEVDRFDVDPDWRWARKQVASLLEAGLSDAPNAIPGANGSLAFQVLEPLTLDPEPDPDYEAQYGGSNSGWDTLSLNTIRPAAIAATFRFVRWIPIDASDRDRLRTEALAVLDRHMDIEFDPALSVRSVYGRFLPLLVDLEEEWVSASIPRIWPLAPDQTSYFWAAWEPYLTFWTPHIGLFRRLGPQYRWAIEQMGDEPDWRWISNPAEKLGEQLIAFYLASAVEYEPWLSDYFGGAPEETAESILGAFGRAIDNELSDRVDRLMALWDARAAQVTGAGIARPLEASAFAWWFPQRSLPIEWALDRLLDALKGGAKIDFPEEVVGRLAEAAERAPASAVEVLRLIVEQSEYPWRLERISSGTRSILSAALGSQDARARRLATQAIGELAMLHNRREYRELLHDAPTNEADDGH